MKWLMYERTGDPLWRARAQDWQVGLAGQKTNTSTHDLGFMLFNSFGNGYRLTGDDAYRQVVLRAAESLAARYSTTVGCIRSWGSIDDTSGRVANAETGHAIPGARVAHDTGSAITGTDGHYRLASVPPGAYRLNISATDYISTTRDVSVTGGLTSTLDIALAPGPAEFGHTVLLPVVIGDRPSSEKRAGRAIWLARCRRSLVVRRWSWPTARR